MGVSFNGATEGSEYEHKPMARRIDGKNNLARTASSGGFGRDSDESLPGDSRSILIQVIEGEIIPRLFLAHRHRTQQRAYSNHTNVWKEAVGDDDIFTNLFVDGNTADIVKRLQSLLDQGISRERVYVHILAPVARKLGDLWEERRCSFEDMAKALACIDEVILEMSTCTCRFANDLGKSIDPQLPSQK
jgi:hypothetical protein